MDKGFKVICLECGKEAVIKYFESDNKNIKIYCDRDGDVNIECDCKNIGAC
ncbi:hypothetical protein WKH56_19560 [Priestia sp. SB1]|uniref:hypothetical protein n=1 Tax=Priestia sp. SB1 TaxID=3132359 RepID=UPI0031765DC1